MSYSEFDRDKLNVKPLSERHNKVYIERDHIPVARQPRIMPEESMKIIGQTAARIRKARELNSSVILAFGAHTIKNGMAPTLIDLMESGLLTHLATNGAGIIHDWEFAYQGKSSEDVRENVKTGQFGIWEETGFYINLALVVGAYEGLGYGESVGKMIFEEGLSIPDLNFLYDQCGEMVRTNPAKASAAADLAYTISHFNIPAGYISIQHPYKKYSVQCKAYELKVPFTGHPMIGHDIIYNHPVNNGGAVGHAALKDFLVYTGSVSNLENGVYLSVGSAVMSPMIFEKALSMARNVKLQSDRYIDDHYILVVDLAELEWDWAKDGEPPPDNPAYYLRYCKTFSRMGGEMHYLTADNRDFLLALNQMLKTTI
jgi:hypothetical protein